MHDASKLYDDRHQAMIAAVSQTFGTKLVSGKAGKQARDMVVSEAYPESEYNLGELLACVLHHA